MKKRKKPAQIFVKKEAPSTNKVITEDKVSIAVSVQSGVQNYELFENEDFGFTKEKIKIVTNNASLAALSPYFLN